MSEKDYRDAISDVAKDGIEQGYIILCSDIKQSHNITGCRKQIEKVRTVADTLREAIDRNLVNATK